MTIFDKSYHALGALPLPSELGFTRVRTIKKWPKSETSDFGRGEVELAAARRHDRTTCHRPPTGPRKARPDGKLRRAIQYPPTRVEARRCFARGSVDAGCPAFAGHDRSYQT